MEVADSCALPTDISSGKADPLDESERAQAIVVQDYSSATGP